MELPPVAIEALEALRFSAIEIARPSTIFKPTLGRVGDKWCALLGPNLVEGVAGFGDTPADAMTSFDAAWLTAADVLNGADVPTNMPGGE